MPTLTFVSAEFRHESFNLPDGTYSVGRKEKNSIIILDDSVSGEHCQILIYGTEVILRDLNSRNGTFVNGLRINPQAAVKHGQEIRLGRVSLRLKLENPYDDDVSAITAMDAFRNTRASTQESAPQFPLKFTPSKTVDT